MDGKKRIARVRNGEKWKRLGFAIPLRKKDRIKAIIVKHAPLGKLVKAQAAWNPEAVLAQFVPICKEPENPSLFKNPRMFIERLQKRGFEPLGSGCYSTVLAKDGSDRVIKVTRQMDNWIDYAIWAAKAGYAGGLAPKVYSWKRHGDWAVSIVERMEMSTYKAEYKVHDQALLMNLLHPAKCGSVMAKLYMEDLVPGSVEFFDQLHLQQLDGDIGGGNVMLRKDGSLCVTDPCAGDMRTSEKRFKTGDFSPVIWIFHEMV